MSQSNKIIAVLAVTLLFTGGMVVLFSGIDDAEASSATEIEIAIAPYLSGVI